MLLNNRIFHIDNGVPKDLSVDISDYLTPGVVVPFVAAEDSILIGSDIPFNHRWFEFVVPNDQAAKAKIQLWNGASWVDVAEVLDLTSVGGASMAQSGILAWVPDRTSTWNWQDTTERLPELATISTTQRLYELFWAKLTFNADLKSTMQVKYIGHRFSNDQQLFGEYPDLANTDLMSGFKTGKTDWLDQEFAAAEYIIQDLREKGVIWSDGQILNWQTFKNASVHKTAQIITAGLGKAYADANLAAMKSYIKNLNLKAYDIDQNKDARLQEREKRRMSAFMTR